MSRLARRDNSSAVSLFPFLAVLLCTMGSLLLLLVVFTRVAREQAKMRADAAAQAAQVARNAPAVPDEEARRELDHVRSYLAELDELEAQATARLRAQERRLSDIEEHMRRLHKQLESLRYAAGELEAMADEHYDDREQAQRELSRLRELISFTEEEISTLRAEEATRKRSYAIIPYQGPSGTTRRPIYIECLGDHVLLQPEGIRLLPADFQKPMGAGNPLAAALRAIRDEVMLRQPQQESGAPREGAGEPYPLIIVRPAGIKAYYHVREAIQSWDADFGYELVNSEWELSYPSPDPIVAAAASLAIEQARARQRLLAAAAPRAYSGALLSAGNARGFGGGGTAMAGAGDSIWPSDAEPDEDDLDGLLGDSSTSSGGEAGFAAAGSTGLAGDERSGSAGGRGTPGGVPPAGDTPGREADTGSGSQYPLLSAGQAGEAGGSDDLADRPAGQVSGVPPSVAGQAGDDDGQDAAIASGVGAATSSSQDSLAGASGKMAAGASATGSPAGASSTPGANGGASRSSSSGAAAGDSSASFQATLPNSNAKQQATQSVAGLQGIRRRSPSDVPIRRTISVVVLGDQVTILPEQATRNTDARDLPGPAPLSPSTSSGDVSSDFMAAIAAHIDSWGIAGQGLYWRPVVALQVGPEGTRRAQEVFRSLNRAGIEVKQPAGATTTRADKDGYETR